MGARTSPVQLLLSSVFRLSDASNNIDWHSYEAIVSHPAVAWSIPISLGDSHRGYRVVGTTQEYFEHLRYGRKQSLRLRAGAWFGDRSGCVLGSEAAEQLGYELGDDIVVAHGAGEISFIEHDEHPFTVTGILSPTGTPVDRSVHVSLEGIEAMHAGLADGHDAEDHDPLSGFVVVVGLTGMLVAIMTSLNERRREMAILGSVGARPGHVFGLIVGEAALATAAGVVAGFVLLNVLVLIARPILMTGLGLYVAVGWPNAHELALAGVIMGAGVLMGVLPACRSCHLSLSDGLTVRM